MQLTTMNNVGVVVSRHEALNDNYLAGYFDGKATIYVSEGHFNSAPQLRLQIRSIGSIIADFIMQTYHAGRLTERGTKFVISSRSELTLVLRAVQPHLLVKQRLVDECLTFLAAQAQLETMRDRRVVGTYNTALEVEIRLAKRAMYDIVDRIKAINDGKDG